MVKSCCPLATWYTPPLACLSRFPPPLLLMAVGYWQMGQKDEKWSWTLFADYTPSSVTLEHDTQYTSSYSCPVVFIAVSGLIYEILMLRILGSHFGPFWWLDDIDDYGKWQVADDFLFVFNSDYSSVSIRIWDIDDINCLRSRPFQPPQVFIGPCWPVGSTFSIGFLLVFCSNHMLKMHHYWHMGMGQTFDTPFNIFGGGPVGA